MKRVFVAVAALATTLAGATPAQAVQEPTTDVLETGCVPVNPSTTVNPEKTVAEWKLTVDCKLLGVGLIKFELSGKTMGKDCTEPVLSLGQGGGGTVSLEADSSATCKIDVNGKGGISFSTKLKTPLNLVLTEFNTGLDFSGDVGETISSTTHNAIEASVGPLARPKQFQGQQQSQQQSQGQYSYGVGDNDGQVNYQTQQKQSQEQSQGNYEVNASGSSNAGQYQSQFQGEASY
ncbi:MAG TPA: hypothetical protein DGT23_11240 [Micromonosporaceae bacterium]|nr:hypothetical protein [Micromonosporaceae bacterium]